MLRDTARASAPMPAKSAPTTARYTPASQPQRLAAPRSSRGSLSVQSPARSGSARGSSGSASESSQSTETPSSAARGASLESSGWASPVSHFDTAWRETPRRPASSSCERPARFLQ